MSTTTLTLHDLGLNSTSISTFNYEMPVKSVDAGCFRDNTHLTGIALLQVEDSLPAELFSGCSQLCTLVLPGQTAYSANIFGDDVSKRPSQLKSIKLSEGTEDIGSVLSDLPGLETIEFPETLQVLRKNSFTGDISLNSLQFKRNVWIDDDAFAGIYNLKTLTFPLRSTSKSLGLQSLTALESVSALHPSSGSSKIADNLLSACKFSNITFEDYGQGLTSLGKSAFENSAQFQELCLSSSQIPSIPVSAFAGCTLLRSVSMNDGYLRKIEEDSFRDVPDVQLRGNKLITSVGYPGTPITYLDSFSENTISIGTSAFSQATFVDSNISFKPSYIGNYAFTKSNVSSAVLDLYSTRDAAGSTSRKVPAHCFEDCTALSSVQVKSCTSVQQQAFLRSSIVDFTTDSATLVAEESAFYECSRLSGLDLQKFLALKKHSVAKCASYKPDPHQLETLTSIGDYAFENSITCNSLSVTPALIEVSNAIGTQIFKGCSIKQLLANETTIASFNEHLSAQVGGGSLRPASPDPDAVKPIYQRLKTYFGLADDFELLLKDFVFNKDGTGNDYACIIMEEKADGWHVKGFDPSSPDTAAFIANPVIPSKASWIDASVFASSTLLTSIQLNNIEHVGENAFNSCTNLKSVSNSKKLLDVGSIAFKDCNALTSFDEVSSLTAIGSSSFANCTKLEQFDFSGLKIAYSQAFFCCTSLTALEAPKLMRIGQEAFNGCTHITKASIPSAEEMGAMAFALNSELTAVDFGTAPLAYLPAFAFPDCSKLDKLKLNENLLDLREKSLSSMPVLSVEFMNRTTEHIDPLLDLDNNCASQAGTKFFTKDNDYNYPMYITRSASEIWKVSNKAFNVVLQGTDLKLTKVDDTYLNPLGNVTIQPAELAGLKVANGALAGTKLVKTVNLTTSLTASIEAGAFANSDGLVAVNINDQYESTHGDMQKETFIDWVGSSSDVKIYFTNGHLQRRDGTTTWDFVVTAEMFVPDPADSSILIGINDNYIPIGGRDATMPSQFRKIATGALSSTVVLSGFTTNIDLEEIAPSAFTDNTSLEYVRLHTSSLTSIGDNAFANTAIKQINIPSTLHVVHGYGLNKNYSLRYLTYDEGIEEVAASAMVNCAAMLSTLKLPTTLTTIGKHAFAEMNSFFPYLVDVQLGRLSILTSVGDYAFYNSIKSSTTGKLTLPANLATVGAASFGYAEDAWTQDISSLEPTAEAPSYLNGRNVEDIGPSAFIYNHLREIRFNKQGLTSIGDYAFAYPKFKCTMQIPKTISDIGTNAFKKNVILNPEKVEKNILSIALDTVSDVLDVIHSLSSPDFTAQNTIGVTDHTCIMANGDNCTPGSNYLYAFGKKLHFSPDNMYINIYKKALVSADHAIVSAYVPPYLNTISAGAFQNCAELLSAVIPNRSSTIGPSAFCGCPKLVYVNGPEEFHLSVIEPYTFYGCKSLENIRVLSNALHIGEGAFYDCDKIASFQTIDQDELANYYLSAIGPSAFAECQILSSFFIPRTILSVDKTAFDNCPSLKNVNIDLAGDQFRDIVASEICSISEVVKSQFGNITTQNDCRINFNDSVYMNDGTVKIDSEFVRLRKIPGTDLSAISAVDYMLLDSENQLYLNLSAISEVDPFVFRGLSSLQTVNLLPDGSSKYLSSIGDYAFSKCASLIRLNSNKLSCEEVGDYAFANCQMLNTMQLDLDLLSSVGQGTFYNSSIQVLTFTTHFTSESDERTFVQQIKDAIGFSRESNPNPLELPEDCQIVVKSKVSGSVIGRYDFMFHSLLHSDIDINRNSLVFIDKRRDAIKPLLLVKPIDGCLPAITKNEFHASIVGRWK